MSTLHKKLGHCNTRDIHRLMEDLSIKVTQDINPIISCPPCKRGKQRIQRRTIKRSISKPTTQPLELIHSDTSGKLPRTIGGNQYFILFIDDYTRWTRVYIISDKTTKTILNAFMHYKNEVESHWHGRNYQIQRFQQNQQSNQIQQSEQIQQ